MARDKQTALFLVLLALAALVALLVRGSSPSVAEPKARDGDPGSVPTPVDGPATTHRDAPTATARAEISPLGWRVRVIALGDAMSAQGAVSEDAGLEGVNLEGAVVEVRVGASWQQADTGVEPVFVGLTDAVGECAVEVVGVPWLKLRAAHFGFVPTELTIAAPRAGEEVVLALATESPGRVLVREAATGRPVAGAHVYLQAASFAPVTTRYARPLPVVAGRLDRVSAVTAADGHAVIHGFMPGLYDLAVVAPGLLAADLRGVELPFAPSPLVVDMQPGFAIDAQVVDEQQQVKVGWDVQFQQGGRTWIAVTDASGHATSPGFAANSVVTVFVPRDDLDLAARFTEAVMRPTRVDVTLPAPQTVRLVVSSGHANPFKVVWPPGAADDHIELEVLQEITPAGHGLSQRITVPAAAGEVEVGAAATGVRGRFVVQGIGKTSGLWRSEPFFVTGPGQIVQLREVTFRSGVLQGRVLDAAGAPVPAAVVALSAVPASLGRIEATFEPSTFVAPEREEATAADGSFFCDLLLPGRYLVAARAPSGRAAASMVQIADSSTVDLVLAAAGGIRGVVRNCPPTGGPSVVVTCAERSWRTHLPVDPAGNFRGSGLVPGLYAVALQRPLTASQQNPFARARSSGEVVIEVRSGEDSDCVLDALTVQRSVRVVTSGLPPDVEHEVQVERLHPYDRIGAQVWRMRRPVPRTGFVTFDDLDPDADHLVSLRRLIDGQVQAWAEVSRRELVVHLRVQPGVNLTVTSIAGTAALALVPVASSGVLARDCLIRPTANGDEQCVFTGLVAGQYQLVAVGDGDYCGLVTAAMPVTVGAVDVTLPWAPGK